MQTSIPLVPRDLILTRFHDHLHDVPRMREFRKQTYKGQNCECWRSCETTWIRGLKNGTIEIATPARKMAKPTS